MAQFYTKREQSSSNTFNAQQMFTEGIDSSKAKETRYLEVLEVFRKIFKGINYRDILM